MKFFRQKISRTFYKYFISYFFIFFLPLTLSFGMFNFHYINMYKDEIFINNTEQTIKMKNSIESQLAQIGNLLKQMTLEVEFTPSYNNHFANRLNTVKRLNGYNAVNDFVYEIIYFQKNVDMAISSNRIMYLNTIDDFYFKYAKWPMDEMLESFYNEKIPKWRPFEELLLPGDQIRKEILTYIHPSRMINSYDANCVIFQIERSAFIKTLDLPANNKSIVVILDSDGNVMFSSESDISPYLTALESVAASKTAEAFGSEYENLFVSCARSNVNGWLYANILPLDQVMGKVQSLQKTYTLFTILLFLLGSLLIYIITSINYNPLQHLLQVINANFKIPDKNTNEIDAAKMALSFLSENRRALEEKLKSSSGYVKTSLLQNLLRGNYEEINEFNLQGKGYGIQYTCGNFFTVVFTYNRNTNDEGQGQLQPCIEDIESFLGVHFECYGFESLDRNYLIFLCASSACDEGKIRRILKEAHSNMVSCFNTHVKVGVSTFTSDITLLFRKYIESINAIEYSPSQPEADIVFFGSDKFKTNLNYPGDEIENLKTALMEYNVVNFNAIFLLLMNHVQSTKLSLFMKVCLCYDIINAINKTIISIDRDALPDIQQYTLALSDKSDNLEKLTTVLDNLYRDVSEYIVKSTGYQENTLIDEIKTYIETYIFDYNLSIQNIADHFNMSLSNLSHYFKKNTGQLISDYISDIKMDYAKDLLRNTETSLQEIMKRLGYTSMSSFIRKFKTYTGTTPGEYKSIHSRK